ncbi:mav [Drosophila busckii]|uniref:Mav n=1 Tax=Drosophila busckii TaxID=30019 RepID=A0A0M4F845_DROBS|nr:bone morphogenetic protein 5 [Drosophila busckii]ALC48132.1 mav [Drosophila busckii]
MNITKNSPSIHEPNSKIKQGTFDNNDLYPNSHKKFVNKKKLQKLIMDGLGLKKLPDMKKANISQLEYATKYIEYLDRLKKSGNTLYLNDSLGLSSASLQMFSVATSSFKDISQKRWRNKRASNKKEHTNQSKKNSYNNDKTNILLHFPLNSSDAPIHYENIDEANVRLMMVYSPSLASLNYRKTRLHTDITKFGSGTEKNSRKINHLTRKKFNCNGDQVQKFSIQQKDRNYYRNRNRDRGRSQMLNIKLYQLLPMTKRQLVDSKTIKFETSEYDRTIEDTRSQWLEFDVTDTVRSWLNKTQENLGIEIQCDKCRRIGARILNDFSSSNGHSNQSDDKDGFHLTPVLNIIGQLNSLYHQNNNKSNNYIYHRSNYGHMKKVRKWRNSCFKDHQRCCRHELDVVFKDIKGFEFIIQPKIFDAGFCRGRCPPRHNPAHHHALLQSLIWQQDHNSVPRPCCAPSKLSELEILHVDEDHSDKLKISTWSDMQILECACS